MSTHVALATLSRVHALCWAPQVRARDHTAST